MSRKSMHRRTFLAHSSSALAAAGLSSVLPSTVWAQSKGANDSIGVGMVGLGIKGTQHLEIFGGIPGVRIVALCDADQERIDKAAQTLRDQNKTANTYQDFRDLLEDKAVDAVVLATPNHLHALQTIWACQAGKDIYVEKPVSHSIWEGVRMMEAAKKYGRVIQGGTQNRSNQPFDEGLAYLRAGNLGAIKGIHGVRYRRRDSIGCVPGPQAMPASVNFDLMTGPAPLTGLHRKKLHYDWHWQWATGNGDMGNNAAHAVDDIRHIMGDDRQPKRVMSVGGRFGYCDDGETPNTHLTIMDYGDFPVFAEIRNLPQRAGVKHMDHLKSVRMGTLVFCEDGYMTMGWGGANAYGHDGKRIQAWPGDGGLGHAANFINAVRQQKPEAVSCPLEYGVGAGEIFHMSNLSHRSGFPAAPAEIGEHFAGTKVGEDAWNSMLTNLRNNNIDPEKEPFTLGSWMSLEDGGRKLVVEDSASDPTAQYLFQPRNYRSPYVVPEKV